VRGEERLLQRVLGRGEVPEAAHSGGPLGDDPGVGRQVETLGEDQLARLGELPLPPSGVATGLIGDFNCELARRRLADAHAGRGARPPRLRPEADDLVTFPSLERRLDWVLVSKEITFVGHRVLDEEVSDHRPVVADLRLTADLR
jgi:endonuclease/exonuclease/phosphatase family metal-dependent hydrolase